MHHHGRVKKILDDNGLEIEHEAFCDENCQDEFQKYWENTPEKLAEHQKRQELIDKGYKPCGRNLIPFETLKIDCNNLIPPGKKYCESCQKLEKERERDIKKRQSENKQSRISKLETKLQSAKLAGNKVEMNNLEQELEKLKSQPKENTTDNKSPLKY
ncbi:MAG: hypothetical protein NY202_05110 [Mollicutes bacterium UO1]